MDTNSNVTRMIVWAAILIIIGYDSLAVCFKWTTISHYVRVLDFQSGGLFRWLWLGLWLHWFIGCTFPRNIDVLQEVPSDQQGAISLKESILNPALTERLAAWQAYQQTKGTMSLAQWVKHTRK